MVSSRHGCNLSTVNYLAPDGTSWMLTKASFHFSDDFYLGPNLDKVILEGVNALSVSSDGKRYLGQESERFAFPPSLICPMALFSMDMMPIMEMIRTKGIESVEEY